MTNLSLKSESHGGRPIRIFLADDHHVVRTGIRRELERHADIEVVGEADNGATTFKMVQQLTPDVLLLDINLPDMSGVELANQIKHIRPESNSTQPWPPAILALSAYADKEYIFALFAAGAKGYLLKDELPQRIIEGVRQVANGLPALSISVQHVLLTRPTAPTIELSAREIEVLELMAKGHVNEEIAQELFIAVGTVKNHVTNIYRKLPNVRTRAEAVAWAWSNGIVTSN